MQDRASSLLFSWRGAMGLFLAYGLAHSLMRLGASWNLGENDPQSALNAQSLVRLAASGASSFDLLVYGLSEILGPTALVFQILRYSLLAIALGFVFATVRRISGSGFWALITVESYALIYQLSWRLHEGYTGALIEMVAVAGLFWALALLIRDRTVFALLLALWFAGLGALSGIWFIGFLIAFLIAVLSMRSLENRMSVIAVLLFGLFLAGLWLWFHGAWLAGFSGLSFKAAATAGLKILAYLSPFLPVVALVFMACLRQWVGGEGDLVCLVRRSGMLAAFGLVGISLVYGRADFSEHAVMPLFFLTPIWIMDYIRRACPPRSVLRFYGMLCLALMGLAFGVRAANLYVLDPVCKRCYFGIPYQGLAAALQQEPHFARAEMIMTPSSRLSGNLYTFWRGPYFAGTHERPQGSALFIWPQTMSHAATIQWFESLGLTQQQRMILMENTKNYAIDWPHLWRKTGYRQTIWRAAILRDDQ